MVSDFGNRQGDPLSRWSFALFLQRIMDKIKNRENTGESVHGNRVNNLRFADDINIIEQSNEELQDTDCWQIIYRKWMIWNAYKCSKDKDKEIQKTTYSWRRSIVVITLVSAGELSLSCTRLLAGWVTTLWLSRPLSVSQHGQLSHPSLRGRYMYVHDEL